MRERLVTPKKEPEADCTPEEKARRATAERESARQSYGFQTLSGKQRVFSA